MNTIGEDVLSIYPSLAKSLRSVSKDLEKQTLKGICNIIPDYTFLFTKIIKYYKNLPIKSPRALFYMRDRSFFAKIIQRVEKNIFYIESFAVIESFEEGFFSLQQLDDPGYMSYETLVEDLFNENFDESLLYDVYTVEYFYRSLTQCKNIPHYSYNKTLEYFNNVLLNPLQFNLYLVLNYNIINIDNRIPITEIDVDMIEDLGFITELQYINLDLYEKIIERMSEIF